MRQPDPVQLRVKIVKPYTTTSPIRFRRYTIVNQEEENRIDLTIGPEFEGLEFGTVSTDIIYGQWYWFVDNLYHLTLFAYVGDYPYEIAKQRYERFIEELPLAALAVIKGDSEFLIENEQLLDSVILVRFKSTYPEFNKTVPFFRISDFMNLQE